MNWLGQLLLRLLRRRYLVERLTNEPGNEMWRLCWWGYNKQRWFARLDWGRVGWRLTRQPKAEHKMEAPRRDGPLRPWNR